MTVQTSAPIARPTGIAHVRLTVTDIERSKAFYTQALGTDPAADFSGHIDEPGAREDQSLLYAGCIFALGQQVVGLRPVADPDDSFVSTRVGLDHVSLQLGSADELRAAAGRLDDAGIEHGEVIELTDFGQAILSFQDPDDINLEFTAPI